MKKNKTNTNKILPILIAVLVVVVVINQYVLMTAVTGNATQKTTNQYGVPLTQAGYDQLLGYDKSISLDSTQMKSYVGLDVEMPCCGFKTLQATGNCGCGHHVALSGLAKLLISKGYSRDQVQNEINSWKDVFFGNNAINMGGC
ncbi:MAG: hypothetical protein AABX14_01760 [Candidatus Aenigmatarchaeota archaeon]